MKKITILAVALLCSATFAQARVEELLHHRLVDVRHPHPFSDEISEAFEGDAIFHLPGLRNGLPCLHSPFLDRGFCNLHYVQG